ncbi:nucleotidyltransferase domain-containing protein [Streptosporangium sp. V21-05]|uniref:nucleotidyltransferase domain-containing protein n=1 Tax=Streptosporangium sp. V21-05 TaxID=3446115 RepID=UPI003F53E420
MKRDNATELVELALTNQVAGQDTWPLEVIDKIYVFGSYARGALEPHDVDLFIENTSGSRRWAHHVINSISRGSSPYSIIRQGLLGRRRGCQLVFDYDIQSDNEAVLLWQQGEPLETALGRLRAIEVDPAAGRAPREAMLREFEGLDRYIPLYHREQLVAAVTAGAISIERLTLDSAEPDPDRDVDLGIRLRWKDASPLQRAARAVLAYWRSRGIDPKGGHLHGRDIESKDTPYFAGFQLRYLQSLPHCFTDFGGVEWIEIPHPTKSKPLEALCIVPGDNLQLLKHGWPF